MTAIGQETTSATEQSVRDLARRFEFAFVGVTPAEPSSNSGYIHQWLADGRHGEMHYLARNVAARIDARQLVAGARTVICVADRYHRAPTGEYHGDTTGANNPTDATTDGLGAAPALSPSGRIARYAWSDDYHKIIKKRLHHLADALRERWPGHVYKSAVDTAPILEREHAVGAGLGWIGKHTLLIHPDAGSWLLLGQIVTTLPVAKRDGEQPIVDHCGTCTRCIDACPTACIEPQGYRLDAKRCISYLTIEHRSEVDPDLHDSMGDWVAGCDICQEVCPFNRERHEPQGGGDAAEDKPSRAGGVACHPAYALRPPAPHVDLLEVLDWSEQDRRAAFERSALKRIKLDQMKRNALIAAGNALDGDCRETLRRRIQAIGSDPGASDLLRRTAEQVMARGRAPS